MAFVVRHVQPTLAGGVPLPDTPDANAYDTPARVNPGVFTPAPCPGTGAPSGTYPKTLYMRSENGLYYRLNLNGAGFGARMDIPGGLIAGTTDWDFVIQLNQYSMQNITNNSLVIRITGVGDVMSIAHDVIITVPVERCARPVNGSASAPSAIWSCSNVNPTTGSLTWATGIAANTASVLATYPGGSSNAFSGTSPAWTSSAAGQSPSVTMNSISGVGADSFSYSTTIVNQGEYWCDPCGGQCYTMGCYDRFVNCDCPQPGSCVAAGSCVAYDCRGTPTGCGGNYVVDCRGMCVDPGSAYQTCSECSGGQPAQGVCSPPGTCHPADCRGVGGGGCAGGYVDCDCPSPGSCVQSCVTRDCAGTCGGSMVNDCAGVCGGTAVDCGCGCGMPCVSCPGGGVSCAGVPCPAPPPSCGISGGGPDFSCCGCTEAMPTEVCSCTGDPSQNCSITVIGTDGSTSTMSGSSFSAPCLTSGLWDQIANCDGSNPFKPASATMTCDNGTASVST